MGVFGFWCPTCRSYFPLIAGAPEGLLQGMTSHLDTHRPKVNRRSIWWGHFRGYHIAPWDILWHRFTRIFPWVKRCCGVEWWE